MKAQQIIRSIVGTDATIYNDRLQDGTRSFKVPGIMVSTVSKIVVALKDEEKSFSTKLYKVQGYCGYAARMQNRPAPQEWRIYVKEDR
jgi:hypothetical protein